VSEPGQPDALLAALAELSGLGGEDDRAMLDGWCGRLREGRLRVLVTGEAKRGKSTLLNALLGRAVLPMGVTPLTALATTVRYGQPEGASVVFRDGRVEDCPLSAFADFVTERGNPGNRRDVVSVTVMVDAPVLARGAELVDTPGTGSVYAHNTAAAEAALDTMDAAVLVLTADPPVSASERELMARVAGLSVTMFVVLNKADYLAGYRTDSAWLDGAGTADDQASTRSGGELAEALDFTARVVAGTAGRPLRVYPVSARSALSGGDRGFAAFAADFAAYLDQNRAADLRLSVAGQARRMTQSLLDEVLLARHAARARTGSAAERVGSFAARLAAVDIRRRDAADVAQGESARLLAELNEAAERAVREAAAQVGRRMESLLMGDLRSAPAGEIERTGWARLAEFAVQAAEQWRQQQAERLEDSLTRLDARLTRDLRAELAAVRDAAAELLGLHLTVPGLGDRLAPDVRFFYLSGGQAGQTELLAGAIRRRLPGDAGRRRARAYLHREAASLVPQQIGRARGDLQYRLADATRQLLRAVGARYGESTSRLSSALRTAAAARDTADGDATRLDRELAARQQALGQVMRLLGQPVADAARSAGPATRLPG
jgi:Dynamin family